MMDKAIETRLAALELMQEKIRTAILQVGSLALLAADMSSAQDADDLQKKHNEIQRRVKDIKTSLRLPTTGAAQRADGISSDKNLTILHEKLTEIQAELLTIRAATLERLA